MKRIGMLITNPFRPDPRMLKEADSLVEAGYAVTIIGWDRTNEMPANEMLKSGVKVIRIKHVRSSYGIGTRQLLHLFAYWRAVFPILDRLEPDLLHCHDFDALIPGLWWGSSSRIPVVYDAREYYADMVKPRLFGWHGKVLYTFITIAEQWAARRAAAIITVDEILGAIYRRYHRRVLVIGHYPSRLMIPQPASVFSHTGLNLLYIGRLSEDRGVNLYAEITRHLLVEGIPARLHLAGAFVPAEDRILFDQHARGIEDFIHIHGWVAFNQVADLLVNADVGLSILKPLPRFVAAIPQKLFEYMAAGLPVVASRFPPIEQVMEPIRCGVLVDPLDNPANIAASIQELWRHPEKAKEMGMNGRRAVLNQFNWESLADQLRQLYNSLIGS